MLRTQRHYTANLHIYQRHEPANYTQKQYLSKQKKKIFY